MIASPMGSANGSLPGLGECWGGVKASRQRSDEYPPLAGGEPWASMSRLWPLSGKIQACSPRIRGNPPRKGMLARFTQVAFTRYHTPNGQTQGQQAAYSDPRPAPVVLGCRMCSVFLRLQSASMANIPIDDRWLP